jgi:hypothetical protein
MNSSTIADLIRRWVDLYTRGMPPLVRAARRDEVEDDLWCHHREASEVGRSTGALGAEMFVRLLFGMPADLSWRFAHGDNEGATRLEKSSSMSTRVLGTLAVLAGLSWTTAMILMVMYGGSVWAGPTGYYMMVFTIGGGLAFAAAAVGLIWRFQEQLHRLGFIGGGTAGLGAFAAAFDGAWVISLLPIGSVALVLDLVRIGVLTSGMAMLHALSAVAMLVLLVGMTAGGPTTDLGLLVLGIPYSLSWIVIGTSLWRGVPSPRAGSGLVSDRGA